ncbi:MAG: bifunctional riboflavin kinase/FMN adenylyltransferase [Planctomycetota bacterium]
MACALTIGNFDGVHLGHRALVGRCVELAQGDGLEVVAVTFDPPPVALLKPEAVPPQLVPVDERVGRLERAGADRVAVVTPTAELLAQSPERYVEALVAEHGPRHVVTGPDFRFGKDRRGDVAMLARLGESHGFAAHVVEDVRVELSQGLAAPCRSTLIRHLVGHARFDDAARCLGEPFALTATVVRGERRGRTIGFPTANLSADELAGLMLPPDGVYACVARVGLPGGQGGTIAVPAAVSIGPKPTFDGQRVTVEAHLIDPPAELMPDADALYGRAMTLAFHQHLRDQQRFPSLDALVAQLGRDVAHTRSLRSDDTLATAAASAASRPA